MLLKALKDLPTSVNAIRKDDLFHEHNSEQAKEWIASGYAVAHLKPPGKIPLPTEELKWSGSTVAVIASGPSLNVEQCAMVRAWQNNSPLNRVIAINTSFRVAPWADILYACDGPWWRTVDPKTGMSYFAEASQYFAIDKMWTQDEAAAKEYGLQFIKSSRQPGLSRTKGIINQGANSGYQAINLAYLYGAKKFILLGFDCYGKHWHGDHPEPINRGMPHGQWKKNFQVLANDLEAEKIEVVNCSPGTQLRAFKTGVLEEELLK